MSDVQDTVIYREIPQFPGYRVGSDGSVWTSLKRIYIRGVRGCKGTPSNEWQRMKPQRTPTGHMNVRFNRYNTTIGVHRLVALMFLGPPPPGMECCHNNGIGGDNRAENLRWDTPKGNSADMMKHGRHYRASGDKNGSAKLTREQVESIRADRAAGMMIKDIVKKYKCGKTTAIRIIHRYSWRD